MPIYANSTRETVEIPGIRHQTLAGSIDGLREMETWMQTIAPHSATPVHRHEAEEVIVVLKGHGRCTIAGQSTDFGPETTIVVPSNVVHDIANTGDEEMWIVASLSRAPVEARTGEGEVMALPWDPATSAAE